MTRQRLDQYLVAKGMIATRSQAESFIRLGSVMVNGKKVERPAHNVLSTDTVKLTATERYVSRAGLKLASVAAVLDVDFTDKIVLDVGSSTGGFTDYALQHRAKKVFAVDVGTDQLHPSLHGDERIELHEKTDIRDFVPSEQVDIVVMDVSFISLREILPHVAKISGKQAQIVAMLKPQFEAGKAQVNKGVIKNDSVRRQILKEFELWAKKLFVIVDKADSEVTGTKGNKERFYLLKVVK
ncbi:MAG TPA: TlyA family RNA methyltransferase [Candidatus Saccharimonadales bacterium]